MESVITGVPWAAVVLACTMIIIDYFFGIIVRAIKKELTSRKMLEGLLHKVCLILAVVVGVVIKMFFLLVQIPESMVGVFGLGFVMEMFGVENIVDVPACLFVCGAIMIMETLSILENFAEISPAAAKLLAHFQQQKSNKEN